MVAVFLGFRRLLLRIRDEFLAALARLFKTHNAVRLGEKGIILADAYVGAGMDFGTPCWRIRMLLAGLSQGRA